LTLFPDKEKRGKRVLKGNFSIVTSCKKEFVVLALIPDKAGNEVSKNLFSSFKCFYWSFTALSCALPRVPHFGVLIFQILLLVLYSSAPSHSPLAYQKRELLMSEPVTEVSEFMICDVAGEGSEGQTQPLARLQGSRLVSWPDGPLGMCTKQTHTYTYTHTHIHTHAFAFADENACTHACTNRGVSCVCPCMHCAYQYTFTKPTKLRLTTSG
jgi:hypothetical protein